MKSFKIARYILLILVICFAIYKIYPQFNDVKELSRNLDSLKNKIHYGWIIAAIISQMTQYIGDGWLSQILLKVVGIKVNIKDSFRIASLNVFAAHILPIGEAGGIAAAYHFYRKLGVDTEKFIFLTICWGIITNSLLFFLMVIPLFFLHYIPITPDRKGILLIFGSILIILTTYFARKSIFKKLESFLGKYNWFQHFTNFIKNRHLYKKILKDNPMIVVKALTGGLIYYGSNIATLGFSFLAFGLTPPLDLVIFAYSASLLLGRLTLAPGGIGATEATLLVIFSEIDPGNHFSITAAILLYRIISFWLPIPSGCISFYSLRKKVGIQAIEDLQKSL